jgi:hypothetical protein
MTGRAKKSTLITVITHSICWGVPCLIGVITVIIDVIYSTSSASQGYRQVWLLIIDNLWMIIPVVCFMFITFNYIQMLRFLKQTGSLTQPRLREIISSISLFNLPPTLQLSLYSFVTVILWLQFLIFYLVSQIVQTPLLVPLSVVNSVLHLQGFFDSLIFGLTNTKTINFQKLNGKLEWVAFYLFSPVLLLPSVVYRIVICIQTSKKSNIHEHQPLIQPWE